ncbi:MAG: type II toxin-antitoxin system RelE/ParE family toxin [Chloroflexota bacterium]
MSTTTSRASLTAAWSMLCWSRKRLRPNDVAEWELRVGRFRVFYDVREEVKVVRVEAVGHKDGNKLFIQGEEYEL